MLRRLGKQLESWSPQAAGPWSGDPAVLLATVWEDVVGPDIAMHSHPLRVADGTLTIVTRSSAWSHQLSFFAERIVTAAAARLPQTPVTQLRFRVGRIPARSIPGRDVRAADTSGRCELRAPAASAPEAVARFRATIDERKRAKRAAGWKHCTSCGALIAPGERALCIACANAGDQRREAAVSQLLFQAPWLGFAATAELVGGVQRQEYDAIRARCVARWWETLARARAAKRLSVDGRERLIASSYVLLKTGLPPERIEPATLRSVLGEELHDLIYETEPHNKHA